MDMRPQGQPPSLYRPNGGGKRKGFRLKIGVGVQEGVHHLPVFPGQQRTGAIQEDAARPDAVLQPYSVRPRVLFFDDATPDADNWRNEALRDYYGKNSVIVLPP